MTDADLANTATDFNPTGYSMGQLRTTNKRHKRAIVRLQARKPAAAAVAVASKPAKADR